MRNLPSQRHDTEVVDETAGGQAVDRRVVEDKPTITQRLLTRNRNKDRVVEDGVVRDRVGTQRPEPATTAIKATDLKATDAAAAGTTATGTTVAERPAADPEVVAPQGQRWAHVSAIATLSLIIGVLAIGATLTGLLAAEGIVLGVIGGAIAAGGLVSASRRGVTGHSLALLGLIASLGAILLGVLAIGGELSWLDSKTDEVTRLHNWLLAQLPWLTHF